MASSGRDWPAGEPGRPESIGALLTRLRLARGLSQLRVAEQLCAVSGMPTVSRHEVSRWEREERVPGRFWLGWLAAVLDAPLAALEAAAAVARPTVDPDRPVPPPDHHRLLRPPDPADLLAELDHASDHDLRELAHAWLTAPPEPPPPEPDTSLTQVVTVDPGPLEAGEARLAELRRMDDLMGGVDLAPHADRELRRAIAVYRAVRGAGPRRRALRLIAELAQLAGWVRADAGDRVGARRAYRLGLRTAAAGLDRPLAAHILGGLCHLLLDTEPEQALLLARTGYERARHHASGNAQALLLHRIALAHARLGERRAAHANLAAADTAAERARPEREPSWLYWLDRSELAWMRGRCLAMLGRSLRAAQLLGTPRDRIGHRTRALYGGWLARAYLDLGEPELACRTALRVADAAVRSGSVRAAAELRRLHPLLLRHRDLTVVRGYERIVALASEYLPTAGPASGPSAARWRGRTAVG